MSNGSVELSLLHVRINELERRLAQLEERSVNTKGPATTATPAPSVELNGNGRDGPESEPAHDGLEGARLIALEMLSSGYERHEVETYLRSTFGVSDTEAVLQDAGLVSG